MLLAVLLVKQKLTAYSAISVALLIAAAAILVLRTTDDNLPAGESTMDYMMGFFMSVIGAVLYGLLLPLIEMIYINAKKAITYTTVLEIQMIIAIFATAFSTVGVIINKDFQAIQEEASQFDIGEVKYYLVLGIAIFIAICGFISYFYGENEQSKKEKQKTIDEDQSQPFLLQLELSM
ncbi:hypothetical protein KY284_022403 [Solanum tuberosum]|nr:hypothetical protein KY284_022403 [Solanum tuberosum]